MKRKGIKSFISIGLASAMLLTACGGSAASSGSNETVPKEESAAEQTTAAAQSGETAKADSSDIVKLRFFNDETWWPYTCLLYTSRCV